MDQRLDEINKLVEDPLRGFLLVHLSGVPRPLESMGNALEFFGVQRLSMGTLGTAKIDTGKSGWPISKMFNFLHRED